MSMKRNVKKNESVNAMQDYSDKDREKGQDKLFGRRRSRKSKSSDERAGGQKEETQNFKGQKPKHKKKDNYDNERRSKRS
eukprot:111472-Amphidinium_carterae.1